MSGLNTKQFPAAAFMKAQREKEKKAVYNAWKAGVPNEWLTKFVEVGLRPFLKDHGYTLSKDTSHVVSCIRQWAFGYVHAHLNRSKGFQVYFVESIHPADMEAFDWFCMEIPSEHWTEISDKWCATEFLDSSDPGLKQRDTLLECIWRLVDLNTSKSHQMYLNTQPYDDSDDEQPYIQHQDDSHAFTGDRRTH
jgi:hypothetical protein